jgi:hypothetical protein
MVPSELDAAVPPPEQAASASVTPTVAKATAKRVGMVERMCRPPDLWCK